MLERKLLTAICRLAPPAILFAAVLASTNAWAGCFYCCSDDTYYDDFGTCLGKCVPTLGCFSNICGTGPQCPPEGSANPPECEGSCCAQAPGDEPASGDPVMLGSGATFDRHLDVSIPGANGPIEIWRMFMSQEGAWAVGASPVELHSPRPFGKSEPYGKSLRHWHSLYSYISLTGSGTQCVSSVRTPSGSRLEIGRNLCTNSPAGTWDSGGAMSQAVRHRLQWTGSGFLLVVPSGGRYLYNAIYRGSGGSLYFLSEIQTAQGAKVASIAYADPGAGCPQGEPGSTPGVPYISRVTDGAGVALEFSYKRMTHYENLPEACDMWRPAECALTRISAIDKATGASTQVAAYEFETDTGTHKLVPGVLIGVTLPTKKLAYEVWLENPYTPASYTKSVDGAVVMYHEYQWEINDPVRVSDSNAEFLEYLDPETGTCLPDSACCDNPKRIVTVHGFATRERRPEKPSTRNGLQLTH